MTQRLYDPALLDPIHHFLHCKTPEQWITEAVKPEHQTALLIDHCNCELKAAQTAMLLIRRYAVDKANAEILLGWLKPYEDFVYRQRGDGNFANAHAGLKKIIRSHGQNEFADELVNKMVLLIKEELHHFVQVLDIMRARGMDYHNVGAGRYAKGMMRHVRTYEPQTLVDKLICGAYIEARSCERFAMVAPHLDDELARFYVSLLRSEARHFQDYLALARQVAGEDIQDRIEHFGRVEAQLIASPDNDFKFHSGLPVTQLDKQQVG